MHEILKKVVLVSVNNIMNIAFCDICLINLKTGMKYSLKFQHFNFFLFIFFLLGLGLVYPFLQLGWWNSLCSYQVILVFDG